MLGVSTPNLNPWVRQILQHGELRPAENELPEKQISAIVKLYDKNINAFKLNEQISFIGILEFKSKVEQQPKVQNAT